MKLEDLLRELPCGVWVAKAPGGELVYANAAFEQIMGMGPVARAKVGAYTQPYGLFGRDGRPYPEEKLPFARALSSRSTVMVDDIVVHRRDGSKVNVRAFGKPLLASDGSVAMVMVSFFDISAEIDARVKLELAVNHAPIIIWTVDRKGIVTLSEGQGLTALGVRSGDLVGKLVYDLYSDNPQVASNITRALGGESFVTLTHVAGAALEGWIGPLRDASGEVSGAIGITTDVTQRHRAQQELFRAEREAAVGTLAASVAHEINNPLSTVLEGLRGIERELAASCPATVKQLLQDVKDGAERVRVITADLQTFTRGGDAAPGPVDISRAARTAVEMLRGQLEARAKLELNLEGGLMAHAAEPKLVQCLLNLLLNALQAVRALEGEQRIRVHTRADGGEVLVEVSDTGHGLDPKLKERLFEPFVTSKPIGEGPGLGLFVCKNLISELGGRIEAETPPGGGALFRVRLPALQAPARREGAKVLIIDDNVNLGRVMASALELGKHQTTVVHTGREAIDLLSTDARFDVVLCDLMMRDVSGMDVYEELERRKPGAAAGLVFMTGGAFTERARRFLDAVPNERLQKPFDICDQVARLLERRAP